MHTNAIAAGTAYRTHSGSLLHVTDVSGQKVSYTVLQNILGEPGEPNIHEMSLGRFATHAKEATAL